MTQEAKGTHFTESHVVMRISSIFLSMMRKREFVTFRMRMPIQVNHEIMIKTNCNSEICPALCMRGSSLYGMEFWAPCRLENS